LGNMKSETCGPLEAVCALPPIVSSAAVVAAVINRYSTDRPFQPLLEELRPPLHGNVTDRESRDT
jgi:hypothetical protein